MALGRTIKTWFRGLRAGKSPVKFDSWAGLNFRLGTVDDIRQLLEIERDVYVEIPWTFSHFQHEIAENPRAAFILAENTERTPKIMGYIGLRWDRRLTELHISNFVVRKSAQHTGIGNQLLTYAEQFSRGLDIGQMSLEVSRPDAEVQGFYRKRGFRSRQILNGYYTDGRDAVEMEKELRLGI